MKRIIPIFLAIVFMVCAFFINNENARLIITGLAIVSGILSLRLDLLSQKKVESGRQNVIGLVKKCEKYQKRLSELERQKELPSFSFDNTNAKSKRDKLKEIEEYFLESSSNQEEDIRAFFKEVRNWEQNQENLVLFKKEKVQRLMDRLRNCDNFPLGQKTITSNIDALVNLAFTAVDLANNAEDDINVNKKELYNLILMKGDEITQPEDISEISDYPDESPAWARAAKESFGKILSDGYHPIFWGKKI